MGALLGLLLAGGVLLVASGALARRRDRARAADFSAAEFRAADFTAAQSGDPRFTDAGSRNPDTSGPGLLAGVPPAADRPPPGRAAAVRHRLADTLVAADLAGLRPGALIATSVVAGLLVTTVIAGISRTYPVAVVFGGFAAWAPFVLVRRRAAGRREELRGLWPDAVDNLASSVRAGLSLPEALIQLSLRGPDPMRVAFARFGADYRATGRFADCLDALKESLADPVADRIIEALRLARDVGGSDLGRLLRTLSAFLREDAHTRGELVSRQSWTVNAARLGVAAPWIVLALLSLQTDVVQQYNSRAGVFVLAIGLATSLVAYRLMTSLGRLPEDIRVLR